MNFVEKKKKGKKGNMHYSIVKGKLPSYLFGLSYLLFSAKN